MHNIPATMAVPADFFEKLIVKIFSCHAKFFESQRDTKELPVFTPLIIEQKNKNMKFQDVFFNFLQFKIKKSFPENMTSPEKLLKSYCKF